MPDSPDFDLRCSKCNWITICGPTQMADWLRRYRVVKGTTETDLLVELFRTSASRFACLQCGQAGLIASPSELLDNEAWGEARNCESCGAAIPPERLEVFPETRLCVACQNRDERGELTGPAEYCPRCGTAMILKRATGSGITRYIMACPGCGR
jgi:hypothetical protein